MRHSAPHAAVSLSLRDGRRSRGAEEEEEEEEEEDGDAPRRRRGIRTDQRPPSPLHGRRRCAPEPHRDPKPPCPSPQYSDGRLAEGNNTAPVAFPQPPLHFLSGNRLKYRV